MTFRYRILLYHDNQTWVNKVTPLLDLPIFHLFSSDSETAIQKRLEEGEADIILAGVNTQHFELREDNGNSLTYKRAMFWATLENNPLVHCKAILLCTKKEVGLASSLVQSGKALDYFVVTPLLDRERLVISILKAIELTLLRDIVQSRLLKDEKLEVSLLESVEMLQELKNRPESAEAASEPEAASFDTDPWLIQNEVETPAEDSAWPSPAEMLSEPEAFPEIEEPAAEEKPKTFTASSIFASLQDDEPIGMNAESIFESLNASLNSKPKPVQQLDLPPDRDELKRSGYDILLLEGNWENITVIQRPLEEQGYRVLVANTAEEGLYYLNKETFEVLLISMELPDEDSLAFLLHLRQNGPQPYIPAIVLSDTADHEHVHQCIRAGVSHIFVRPYNADRLLKYVNDLIYRR